jgi:hypothetical protein
MNLEEIKEHKIREAAELFEEIGLDPKKEVDINYITYTPLENLILKQNYTEEKLHWTRLSNNSNIGYVID